MDKQNQNVTLSYILIFIGLVLFVYLIGPHIQKAIDTNKSVQDKIVQVESKRNELQELKNQSLQEEQEQKTDTKPVYKNDVEVTDNMSSFGVMFEDVIQSAKYNGLKLRSIQYNESPADDPIQASLASEYNVCAIKMQLIGSYVQFRSYFQDLYNYPYVINIDKISIKPYEKNKKILIANIIVTLYSSKTEAQKAEYAANNAPAVDAPPAQ